METKLLENHIMDTIKEWQMKIGFQAGSMRLYYPDSSLIQMLGLDCHVTEAELQKAMKYFTECVYDRLGDIRISHKEHRYCLEVSDTGCRYINEQVPDSEFLKRLLAVMDNGNGSMKQVREAFSSFADEKNGHYEETDHGDEELGRVFFFDRDDIDPYVYCVEQGEFGITYHRFSRSDYMELLNLH